MGLRQYWIVIRRRKRLVLACLVSCIGLAIALNELTTPVYRSSIRVEMRREQSRSPLTGAVTESPTSQSDNQALLTAAEILTSRTLMAQVVTSLERQGTPIGPRGMPQDLEQKVDWLLARVTVEPLRDTRLILISVEHSNVNAAVRIAKAIAENFVRSQRDERSQSETTLASYLRAQAADVKKRVEDLEQRTRDTKQPGVYSLDGKIQQVTATVAELNASYAKTKTQDLTMSSQLDVIRRVLRNAQIDPNEIPIHTDILDGLRRDVIVSNTALEKAREMYGANHPKLVALQSENDEIRRNLRQEVKNAVYSLSNERSILVGREESLRAAIAQAESELRSLNEEAEKFSTVEAEIKSDRDLYNLLMARIHEVEITGEIKSPPLRVIEAATVDLRPVRPRKFLNLGVGVLLGLLSGSGLAFLLDSFRRTIRTPEDVDQHLQLPVLGLIPKESIP
ncbi:MAG: hypothetical protein E6K76_09620 [Candidatus Eisenbacteria bacterium]|uniref:Polysaccharide chain length determinant N-terminal domain-containing protein n=1 Tax=Eiseniibacteriota bacterium TaxID=2212470 RepID=A0A538T2D1_UNCEI|nr:MAG: hypothetical protein E6K76_09620 [Candidatus Eisenbacteria bacterium]